MGSKGKKTPAKMIPMIHVDIPKVLKAFQPCFLNVAAIANKAERASDLMAYDSLIDETEAAMVTDGTDVLILTRDRGYLRLRREVIPQLISELMNVEKDMYRNIWGEQA